MITYRNANINDLEKMCLLFNEVVNLDGFYKPFSVDEYKNKMLTDPNFSLDNVYLALSGKMLVSFMIVVVRPGNCDTAYINALVTKKEYRNQGIASNLLDQVERDFLARGFKTIVATNFLPSCYAWYIPNTDKHDHPCAPGISINSSLYFFYLHHRFDAISYQDAFHLNLSSYKYSDKINEIIERNKKDGFTVELYDKDKHYGLDEFYEKLNIYDFEKVIKENLALEKPYPFLVIAKDNRVVGWTGAMWNEESGRGHFDGIANLPEVRGRGLGKALFSSLAYYSKQNGAKFMTFYTGLTNPARNIYMDAGFKIIQSFCAMKKVLKKD